ncbi:MAG: CHAT domain-containing protein [Cyanobacteria bacterium CRU_2_1]|nr:CHAT domain-containing protein [Cyanobacteria bacterium RU_5_0]NJR61864.1 CHAT domain-containing protein [Cyanobacteria bacterium CRU_2_1]
MTQEFHISVTPVGNDEYLVRTERVAPGVPLAEEQVKWAVESWLVQARQLMSDPLVGLLKGDRPTPLSEAQDLASLAQNVDLNQPPLSLVELGQQLYSALFQGTLRDSWVTAQGIAQHRNEALRLRLGLKGSRLPRLPWEVLYGNDTPTEKPRRGNLGPAPRPLATGTHVIFSRYQPGTRFIANDTPITEPGQPLRILMVIAAPSDQQRLELYREANQLQQELRTQNDNLPDGLAGSVPDIQLTILNQPGREQLTQALEQGRYQVLHYAGHSDLGAAGGSLYLVNNRTGLTEVLSGDDLAGLLVNNGIRLTVFNSCRGAYTAASDPVNERERNLAEALVGRGLPAVLAMAEQIPDNVALTLTWLFYRNLKLGYPIDLSLSRARQGLISAYGSNQLYWALPILYLHPEFDGYLTAGDRSANNPADRLVLIPQNYSAFPILATEEVVPPIAPLLEAKLPEPTDEEMVTNAVMGEDEPTDWVDEVNYLDESYDDDASVVADLLRQLTPALPDLDDESIAEQDVDLDLNLDFDAEGDPDGDTALDLNFDFDFTDINGSTPKPTSPPVSSSPSTPLAATILGSQPTEVGSPQTAIPPSPQKPPSQPRPIAPSPTSSSTPSSSTPVATGLTVQRSRSTQRTVLPVVGGIIGVVAIAALGFWLLPRLQQGELSPLPGDKTVSLGGSKSDPTQLGTLSNDLQTADSEQVKERAIDYFNQQQLPEGAQAVAILLDRDALAEANTALAAVPVDANDPNLDFLRGRLVWQSVKAGDSAYRLEDARQYWEKAAQAEPNSPLYQEALGFAYYAEGKPSEAVQYWVRALSILENQRPSARETSTEPPAIDSQTLLTQPGVKRDILNSYAGIALALVKTSSEQSPVQQQNLSSKASKIYQMVLASDPENFQSQALQQNWLWNEMAIQDWEALSQLQP